MQKGRFLSGLFYFCYVWSQTITRKSITRKFEYLQLTHGCPQLLHRRVFQLANPLRRNTVLFSQFLQGSFLFNQPTASQNIFATLIQIRQSCFKTAVGVGFPLFRLKPVCRVSRFCCQILAGCIGALIVILIRRHIKGYVLRP